MFKIEKEIIEWGGKTLTIETGRVARQAHGWDGLSIFLPE